MNQHKQHIKEFENNHSTAAGKGGAYPHSTSIEAENLICILGISKTGLDFNSPDSQLCHIILLSLSSKDKPDKHRKFITLFRSMIADSNILTLMLEANNASKISSIINNWEDKYVKKIKMCFFVLLPKNTKTTFFAAGGKNKGGENMF